ncbi:MAG: AAA family ATPase [bacterium]
MNYRDYFKFKISPFSTAPDDRFYYNSPNHSKAVTKMIHAAEERRGLAVLIGDIGTGKTTLSRKLLDYFASRKEYKISLLVIIHSEITAHWLLKRIALQLGADVESEDKMNLIQLVYKRLDLYNRKGKKVVVMIDEANMLKSREIMEEFRGLLNMQNENGHMMTFLMFGMPELEVNLKLDPPLYERISIKQFLRPLDIASTKNYINHRLAVAGRQEPLFTDQAIEIIHQYSKGKPRLINIVCDNALLEAFLEKKQFIDPEIIKQTAGDLGFT